MGADRKDVTDFNRVELVYLAKLMHSCEQYDHMVEYVHAFCCYGAQKEETEQVDRGDEYQPEEQSTRLGGFSDLS